MWRHRTISATDHLPMAMICGVFYACCITRCYSKCLPHDSLLQRIATVQHCSKNSNSNTRLCHASLPPLLKPSDADFHLLDGKYNALFYCNKITTPQKKGVKSNSIPSSMHGGHMQVDQARMEALSRGQHQRFPRSALAIPERLWTCSCLQSTSQTRRAA